MAIYQEVKFYREMEQRSTDIYPSDKLPDSLSESGTTGPQSCGCIIYYWFTMRLGQYLPRTFKLLEKGKPATIGTVFIMTV